MVPEEFHRAEKVDFFGRLVNDLTIFLTHLSYMLTILYPAANVYDNHVSISFKPYYHFPTLIEI